MADVDVSLGLDTADFNRKLNQAKQSISGLSVSAGTLGKAFVGAFAAVKVVEGLANMATAAIRTSAQFEQLKISLTTVTGSAKVAEQAFAAIQDFAAKTPYAVAEVTTAFTKLAAYGIAPTEEAMTAFGNTASGMGKTLDQMVEAVADAAVGEFERLKEFGIKARSEGDNVSFTFQGVTTTVKKNSDEIVKYLTQIGNVNFAGGMEAQSKSMTGLLSTLMDSFATLADDVLKSSGAFDFIKNEMDALIKQMPIISAYLVKFAEVVGNAFGAVFKLFVTLSNSIKIVFETIKLGYYEFMSIFDSSYKEMVEKSKARMKELLDSNTAAMKGIVMNVKEGAGAFADLVTGNVKAAEATKKNTKELDAWIKKVKEQSSGGGAAEQAKKDAEALSDLLSKLLPVSNGAKILNTEMTILNKALKEGKITWEQYADATLNAYENFEKLKAPAAATVDALKDILDRYRPMNKAMEDVNKEMAILDKALAEGKISWDQYADATLGALERLDTLREKKDPIKDTLYTWNQAFKDLHESTKQWGAGLSETLRSGGSLLDYFGNKVVRAFDKIADSFFQNAIDEIFSGRGNSNPLAGIGKGISDFFGGFFAEGGYLPAGKFGIVGEKGPEIITGPANVMSNRDSFGQGGGIQVGTLTNNFSVNMNDFESLFVAAARKNADYLTALNKEVNSRKAR